MVALVIAEVILCKYILVLPLKLFQAEDLPALGFFYITRDGLALTQSQFPRGKQ